MLHGPGWQLQHLPAAALAATLGLSMTTALTVMVVRPEGSANWLWAARQDAYAMPHTMSAEKLE